MQDHATYHLTLLTYLQFASFSKQIPLFLVSREDMRNSFNFLLIALICMDSSYLIGWIIEAFRKSFQGRKERRKEEPLPPFAELQNCDHIQGWAKEWSLGCVIPASWLPLTA